MDLAEDMYKEELLDHYRNPNNFGKIQDPDIKYHDFNPVCGDEIEIFINVKNKVIKEIKFIGKGCAISQAAASLLTQHIKGKQTVEIRKMSSNDMLELLPIEVSHLRIKCALLAMKAVQKGITIYEGEKIK